MTQLIINGTQYPETSGDKYRVWKEDLGEKIRMAGGNLVFEKRGQVWHISYEYDYFRQSLMNTCLTDLRSGNELSVSFLLEDNTYTSGLFRCISFPAPMFAFSKGFDDNAQSYWHGIAFELEGVETI